MPNPNNREEMARERDRGDRALRQDAARRGGRPPAMAPRHFRGMLPGGRMYGEDDSVVAYFVGHAWRGMKLIGRLFSVATQRRSKPSDDLRNSIGYKDYDGK